MLAHQVGQAVLCEDDVAPRQSQHRISVRLIVATLALKQAYAVVAFW
jgi:hypothetical protein